MHPLDKYREKYRLWTNDQVLLLTDGERAELLELIRAKVPDYTHMQWCGSCVGKMFDYAFELYPDEPKPKAQKK